MAETNPVLIQIKEMVAKKIYPVVEFTEHMTDIDNTQFEADMLARIISITHINGDSYNIEFSEKDFRKYNEELERPDWYNEETKEFNLKYSQKFQRKEVVTETFYYDDDIEFFLKLTDKNPYIELIKEYQELKTDLTYQEWLQEQVLMLRELID